MVVLLKKIYEVLTSTGADTGHGPVAANLPLTGSVLPILLANIAYVTFVYKIGPNLMKYRQPFNLRNVIVLYNIFQIIINVYLFVATFRLYVEHKADLGCVHWAKDGEPGNVAQVNLAYTYYVLKYIDFLDTIFFVLRKSYKQVTFLHVFHHVSVTLLSYFYIRNFGFGGHATFIGFGNCFVHAVMYLYYLLSTFQSGVKTSMWWKKYITLLQMFQFVLFIIQQAWPLLFRPNCSCSKGVAAALVTENAILLYLFSKFYIKTYIKSKRVEDRKQK